MKVEKEEANIAAIEKKPLPIEPVREIGDRSSRSDEILTSGNRPILKPNDGLASSESHPHDAQLFVNMYPTQCLGRAVDDSDDSLRPLIQYTQGNSFDLRGISDFLSSFSSPNLQCAALQVLEHAAKWQSTNFTESMSVTFGPVAELVLDSRDIQVRCAALDTLKLYLASPHAADIVKSKMPRGVVDAVANDLNSSEPLVQLASVELLEVAAQSEEIFIVFAVAVSRISGALPSMPTTTQVTALRVLEIREASVRVAIRKALEAGAGTEDPDLARGVKTILPVEKNRSSDEIDAHRAVKQVREVDAYSDQQASRSVGQKSDVNATGNHYVMRLNNFLQARYGPGVSSSKHHRYEETSSGPNNRLVWEGIYYINGIKCGIGRGLSKKLAKEAAAKRTIELLGQEGDIIR